MPSIENISLADLLVDIGNARLKDEQPDQQAALLALARQQDKRLLKLAEDIISFGVDPTTFPAVMLFGDHKNRYMVHEGNRRVTALKALENPVLVAAAYDASSLKRLNTLAARFALKPIRSVKCILFNKEEEAELDHWVTLRHSGQSEGAGLVEWGSEEKDRHAARRGQLSPAGQILDFVNAHGNLSDEARSSTKPVITNLARFISTPEVRDALGFDIVDGRIKTAFSANDLAKSLSYVVEGLKSDSFSVGQIYHKKDRLNYIKSFPIDVLPAAKNRSEKVIDLGDLKSTPSVGKTRSRPKPRKPEAIRTCLILSSCHLNVSHPRIDKIYRELMKINTEEFQNASSVTLRVFLELSMDYYLDKGKLMSDADRRKLPLVKKIKVVLDDLLANSKITTSFRDAIIKLIEGNSAISASTVTFNMFVHNYHVYPKASELRTAWDELQPLIEAIWP